MTEIRFYHLERRKIEDALPSLLEEAQASGVRVVVQAPSRELIEALDERLWTYSDDGFLPHGPAWEADAETQPVVLADDDRNPNGAAWRVLLGGARVLPILTPPANTPALIILLFDGADEESRAAARAQWSELKAAGCAPSYWREDDTGHWRQAR
ncbi:MAG TPA: DNA polymerase III subunit chi [Roseiarcus sp.]|nr:DNA polymerase III subunit chi [Roseiarcus sp.]